MSAEIVERVLQSTRYRGVDPALVARLAAEELPRSRSADDAVKRVKRRLHQAVGAFRGARAAPESWPAGDAASLRAACLRAMARHASTRERIAALDRFHEGIWAVTGRPSRILDLGCGLHPLSLPWMGIGAASYLAIDADAAALSTVEGFLAAVGQPHRVDMRDLARDVPDDPADVALLLKLVTTLDRQDPAAADRLLGGLRVRHAVVSFAARSLGGRGGGREATYRERMVRLTDACGRVRSITETSVPNELVFVLELEPMTSDG
ncbi:MAG TPA: 16S rRNA methyltransferase [Candidatus Angelobacter sp.]|nr:16S rRNA methyltransferase [Candidatus Angelobacter sp.]